VGPKAGEDGDHVGEGMSTSGVVSDIVMSPDDGSLRRDDVG
jgi:hypothetical protein